MNTFENQPLNTQTHDSEAPPNLVEFMLTRWRLGGPAKGKRLKYIENFLARRRRLSEQFPGELLIIPAGSPKVRSNDTFFPFRPNSDFYYFVGSHEPECVLVLQPTAQGHRSHLFVDHNPGRSDKTFFTDRIRGELWEGAGVRLGVEPSQKLFEVDEAHRNEELFPFITKVAKSYRLARGYSNELDQKLDGDSTTQLKKDAEFMNILHEMRLLKDKEELKEISLAIDATKRGFEDVIARMKKAKSERELEGVFYTRARMEGNDVGYSSIVASGDHACTLHWKKNNGQLNKGDLLLLDAGVEGNSLYTADITRTLPISGKFSKEQAQIYELVLKAQQTAMKQVKPGNDFMAPNVAAMEVLAHGLEELGILPFKAHEALKPQNQFYKRYSLHNVSHMLGLDVHDCAKARAENYKYGKLKEGMVLTVEPGLYFQPDDLTVPAKYRGIGIRIEDDVVVTAKGCKNLSAGLPSELKEVESWIKKIWSRS